MLNLNMRSLGVSVLVQGHKILHFTVYTIWRCVHGNITKLSFVVLEEMILQHLPLHFYVKTLNTLLGPHCYTRSHKLLKFRIITMYKSFLVNIGIQYWCSGFLFDDLCRHTLFLPFYDYFPLKRVRPLF